MTDIMILKSTFPCLGLKVVKVCKHWQVTFPSWLKSNCQTFTTHCVVTVASLLSTRLTRHTAASGGEVRPLGISGKLAWFNRNFFLWKSQRQNYKETHNPSYIIIISNQCYLGTNLLDTSCWVWKKCLCSVVERWMNELILRNQRCTGITEVMGLNPIEDTWNFSGAHIYRQSLRYCPASARIIS